MTDVILKSEERAVFALRSLYRGCGYLPYKMSQFESYDFYVRNKDFLQSDKIITFSDSDGRLMALKPDVTLSIVKNAPEEPGVVEKLYYNENVYRDYREIMQTGLECVGDLGSYEIAEVVGLALKSLEKLGRDYVLDVSHMGLVSAVLDSCGLDAQDRKQALACLMRKSVHELEAMCQSPEGLGKLRVLAACHGSGAEALKSVRQVLTTEAELNALRELEALWETVGDDHLCLDFSVGSSLGYYSGVVFRGYLAGIPTSVLSGGQYDKLAKKLGKNSRAIGFAVYVDNLEEQEADFQSVDTLILHDGHVPTKTLAEAAEKARETGSVLVSRTIPKGRSWKNCIRLEGASC